MTQVALEGLELGYDGRPAVRGLTGAFAPGLATAIVGPNGAGKSTLLKGLAGLLPPLAGRVRREGSLAYLPQDAGVDRAFPITLEDFVALGLERRLGLFRGLGASERAALDAALADVGLAALARRPIAALSGGQFQRALFARVILEDADAILLDEPFAAQDAATADHLVDIVRRWKAEGRTLLIVLHDLALARALCDQALVLAAAPLAWGPINEALTPDVLARAQTLAAKAAA